MLAAAALLAASAGTAAADCTTGGSSCLPGSGYTLDENWNCGAISSPTRCYYYATTDSGSATSLSFGWGSAAYNGRGSVSLCMFAGAAFSACGTNIARGCYFANCNDQDVVSLTMDVENYTGTHTVWGHGMA